MEWLFGSAVVPFLVCGLMCLGGIALAVFGFRRERDARHHETSATAVDRDAPSSLVER